MIEFLRGWDHQLTFAINSFATARVWGATLAIFAAEYLIFFLAITTVCIILYRLPSKIARIEALRNFLASAVFAYITQWTVSLLWFRERPFVVFSAIHRLIALPVTRHSFPSGHAALAASFAAVIYVYDRKLGKIAWVIAGAVALGRVAVGVHYIADIVAGLFIGFICAKIIFRISRSLS